MTFKLIAGLLLTASFLLLVRIYKDDSPTDMGT